MAASKGAMGWMFIVMAALLAGGGYLLRSRAVDEADMNRGLGLLVMIGGGVLLLIGLAHFMKGGKSAE